MSKTDEIKTLEKKYKEVTGQNYYRVVGEYLSVDEIIAQLKDCIKNKKPRPEPEYNDEYDY